MSAAAPLVSAGVLRDLVDVLIPGDDLFPAASAAGAHGLLAERFALAPWTGGDRPRHRRAQRERWRSVIHRALSPAKRIDAVRQLEREEPQLFDTLRTVLYYSYYQSPLVVRAIRALGHDYNDAPQPRGYAMIPFDPTPGVNVPATPRGGYKRTHEITRVDRDPIATHPVAEEA